MHVRSLTNFAIDMNLISCSQQAEPSELPPPMPSLGMPGRAELSMAAHGVVLSAARLKDQRHHQATASTVKLLSAKGLQRKKFTTAIYELECHAACSLNLRSPVFLFASFFAMPAYGWLSDADGAFLAVSFAMEAVLAVSVLRHVIMFGGWPLGWWGQTKSEITFQPILL